MSTPSRTEKPQQTKSQEKPDPSKVAAFKAWLRERKWEQTIGRTGGLRVAAICGSLGLALAVWLLGSLIFRSAPNGTDAAEPQTLVSDPVNAPGVNLEPKLGDSAPEPEFKKPVVKEKKRGRTKTLQVAAIDGDALPPAPPEAQPKPVKAPEQNLPQADDPFAAPITAITPEPAAKLPESAAKLPEPAEKLPEPAPVTAAKPQVDLQAEPTIDSLPLDAKPAPEKAPLVAETPVPEKPAEEKLEEPIEPVVPVEEKPREVVEKSVKPAARDDELLGGEDRTVIERGTAIVPASATPEVEPPKTAAPAKPDEPLMEEAPAQPKTELPAEEPKTAIEPAAPVVTKEKPEVSPFRDDEPIGGDAAPAKPAPPAVEVAPKDPPIVDKTIEEKPDIEKGVKIEAPLEKPEIEAPAPAKPEPAKPKVVEPEAAVEKSPLGDDAPLTETAAPAKPEPKVEAKPQPKPEPKIEPAEEADISTPPEKREPRPQPTPDRLPRPVPEATPKPEPAQPAVEPARPAEARGVVGSPPQIDFELIAPLHAQKGAKIGIGFKVTNIGTTDIDGLVFYIRLPASLKHRAGRDVEYRLDRLAAGQSHSAEMQVLAENVEVALIRAEMAVGRYRLATSDRQINVHGISPTGFIQRTSAEVPAPPPAKPSPFQLLHWPVPAGGANCNCD